MISVLDHIEHLSAKHDCVIVPGLGAFISQYAMSRNANGVVCSLKRDIVFNTSVDYNDGLLTNSLIRRENISFDCAKSHIDDYVRSLRSQLKHEGEVPVGRLGYFKYNDDETLEFFPFASHRANNEYFGLSALTMSPLAARIEATRSEERTGNTVPFVRRFMQVAATIILLIGLTIVLSTPVIEQDNQNYANMNAFTIKHSQNRAVADLCIAVPKTGNEEPAKEVNPQLVEDKNTEPVIVKTNNLTKGGYCLVVASLATEKQAKQYIDENNLTECDIFKSTSKYRVYVARGSFDEMIKIKNSQYSDSDAWVCRM